MLTNLSLLLLLLRERLLPLSLSLALRLLSLDLSAERLLGESGLRDLERLRLFLRGERLHERGDLLLGDLGMADAVVSPIGYSSTYFLGSANRACVDRFNSN